MNSLGKTLFLGIVFFYSTQVAWMQSAAYGNCESNASSHAFFTSADGPRILKTTQLGPRTLGYNTSPYPEFAQLLKLSTNAEDPQVREETMDAMLFIRRLQLSSDPNKELKISHLKMAVLDRLETPPLKKPNGPVLNHRIEIEYLSFSDKGDDGSNKKYLGRCERTLGVSGQVISEYVQIRTQGGVVKFDKKYAELRDLKASEESRLFFEPLEMPIQTKSLPRQNHNENQEKQKSALADYIKRYMPTAEQKISPDQPLKLSDASAPERYVALADTDFPFPSELISVFHNPAGVLLAQIKPKGLYPITVTIDQIRVHPDIYAAYKHLIAARAPLKKTPPPPPPGVINPEILKTTKLGRRNLGDVNMGMIAVQYAKYTAQRSPHPDPSAELEIQEAMKLLESDLGYHTAARLKASILDRAEVPITKQPGTGARDLRIEIDYLSANEKEDEKAPVLIRTEKISDQFGRVLSESIVVRKVGFNLFSSAKKQSDFENVRKSEEARLAFEPLEMPIQIENLPTPQFEPAAEKAAQDALNNYITRHLPADGRLISKDNPVLFKDASAPERYLTIAIGLGSPKPFILNGVYHTAHGKLTAIVTYGNEKHDLPLMNLTVHPNVYSAYKDLIAARTPKLKTNGAFSEGAKSKNPGSSPWPAKRDYTWPETSYQHPARQALQNLKEQIKTATVLSSRGLYDLALEALKNFPAFEISNININKGLTGVKLTPEDLKSPFDVAAAIKKIEQQCLFSEIYDFNAEKREFLFHHVKLPREISETDGKEKTTLEYTLGLMGEAHLEKNQSIYKELSPEIKANRDLLYRRLFERSLKQMIKAARFLYEGHKSTKHYDFRLSHHAREYSGKNMTPDLDFSLLLFEWGIHPTDDFLDSVKDGKDLLGPKRSRKETIQNYIKEYNERNAKANAGKAAEQDFEKMRREQDAARESARKAAAEEQAQAAREAAAQAKADKKRKGAKQKAAEAAAKKKMEEDIAAGRMPKPLSSVFTDRLTVYTVLKLKPGFKRRDVIVAYAKLLMEHRWAESHWPDKEQLDALTPVLRELNSIREEAIKISEESWRMRDYEKEYKRNNP